MKLWNFVKILKFGWSSEIGEWIREHRGYGTQELVPEGYRTQGMYRAARAA